MQCVAVVVADLSVSDHVQHPVLGSDHGRDRRRPLSVHLSPVAQRRAHEPITCEAGRHGAGPGRHGAELMNQSRAKLVVMALALFSTVIGVIVALLYGVIRPIHLPSNYQNVTTSDLAAVIQSADKYVTASSTSASPSSSSLSSLSPPPRTLCNAPCLLVCLSVCLLTTLSKTTYRIFMKLSSQMYLCTTKKSLNFASHQTPDLDPGIFKVFFDITRYGIFPQFGLYLPKE